MGGRSVTHLDFLHFGAFFTSFHKFLQVFTSFHKFSQVFTISLTRARDLRRWPCLGVIYIKSARDREMKTVSLNRAGKIWSICSFLQVKFRSFLEILETFEKIVFFDSF